MSTQSKICTCVRCPGSRRTSGWRNTRTVLRSGCNCSPACACGRSCGCQAA